MCPMKSNLPMLLFRIKDCLGCRVRFVLICLEIDAF